MVDGEYRKHPAAIIVPAFEYLKRWCRVEEIPYSTDEEIILQPKVIQRIEREIEEINQYFGQHEQIKKWRFIAASWYSDLGELSPTLKNATEIFNRLICRYNRGNIRKILISEFRNELFSNVIF